MAPESCMVLLNEHPQLKYATTRSVAKHSVGESNTQLFEFFSAAPSLTNVKSLNIAFIISLLRWVHFVSVFMNYTMDFDTDES